jgi:hypothetical protein
MNTVFIEGIFTLVFILLGIWLLYYLHKKQLL